MRPKPAVVCVALCGTYDLNLVRGAVSTALAPLGGMRRFVHEGMRVLLKPNLVNDAGPERAVTTHPAVVQVVAEMVQAAGGQVQLGDSPGGPISDNSRVYRGTGMAALAHSLGANLVFFDKAVRRQVGGNDCFVASPILDADLVINLPKLKTHIFTLYTGAVKNLFGAVPGTRKRELHCEAPGVGAFSRILVDVLDIVRPQLSILDGVVGLEGNGPGTGGTLHGYGCIAASEDPVALDAVAARAMGFARGEVVHLALAANRGLGVADPTAVRIEGDRRALAFGELDLPKARWYLDVPSWVGAPVRWAARIRPRVLPSACIGCGRCVEVCPAQIISRGNPPTFDLRGCIGCMCCAEICPKGAILVDRNLVARLIGLGQ